MTWCPVHFAGGRHPSLPRRAKPRHHLKRDLQGKVLETNKFGRKVLFDRARQGQDPGNYPAPERIIEVVRIGVEGMQAGLQGRGRHFGELVMTPVRRPALRSSPPRRKKGEAIRGAEPLKVGHAAVLGAA